MAETVSSEQSTVIKWKVEHFFSVSKLESEVFSFSGSDWCFELVKSRWPSKCIGIYLHRKDSNETIPSQVRILAFIEDSSEDAQFPYGWTEWRPNNYVWKSYLNYLREKEDTLLTGDAVTFVFLFPPEITSEDQTETDIKSALQASGNNETISSVETLTLDFCHLLEDGTHSDVTLKCGDTTLPVHNCILSARSKVFAEMLRLDSQNGVEISDMDPPILKQLLQFIYSGKLSDLSMNIAPKLYAAGDKYDVESLKMQCSVFMQRNLTAENVCDILTLADVHSDGDLKECAATFVLDMQLMKDDEIWLKFCDVHPKLALEILNRAYKEDTV